MLVRYAKAIWKAVKGWDSGRKCAYLEEKEVKMKSSSVSPAARF